MKIIQQGEIPETRTHRATCGKCKTIFEFAEHEARFFYDQRDGKYMRIACPVCNREVIKESK